MPVLIQFSDKNLRLRAKGVNKQQTQVSSCRAHPLVHSAVLLFLHPPKPGHRSQSQAITGFEWLVWEPLGKRLVPTLEVLTGCPSVRSCPRRAWLRRQLTQEGRDQS